jgi:chorismate dehydratase
MRSIACVSYLNAKPLFDGLEAEPEIHVTTDVPIGCPVEIGAADAVLLIGDKVITSAPDLPHQLDLGEAWKRITGLPFVFAVWMTTANSELGELPARLRRLRQINCSRIPEIVERHAPPSGWPVPLAEHYLGNLIRYGLGERELKAITEFWKRCHDLDLIERLRPLELYTRPGG